MGLGLLGRGRASTAITAALHLAGAAVGGAALGVAVGAMGELLSLGDVRPWLIGAAAVIAWHLARRPRPVKLGRQCQVPQAWARSMAPPRRYLLWGAMLGSGVATLIPYSVFLVMLAAQSTAGIATATLAGAVFGLFREGMALAPLLAGLDLEGTRDLLPALRSKALLLNRHLSLAAGATLLATSLR
jgi:hypothetical protein